MFKEIPISFSSDANKMMVGLQWDPNEVECDVVEEVQAHNLDLSCVVLTPDMNVKDIITPTDTKREEYRNQIFHKGDNLSGGSDFEDEEILLTLDSIGKDIGALAFVVSTHNRVDIADVKNGSCHFLDMASLNPFLTVDFKEFASVKGDGQQPFQQHFLAGVLIRKEETWVLNDIQSKLPSLDSSSLEVITKGMAT